MSQGCTKNEDNTQKEQQKEHRGCVADHSTIRERETIRHNKSESYRMKYLETGSKGGVRNVVQRFREFRNRSELRRMRGGVRTGAKEWESIAEFGFEYFCSDYVRKNGVSVMERNSIPPSRTSSRGPIEFRGKFGLGLKIGRR